MSDRPSHPIALFHESFSIASWSSWLSVLTGLDGSIFATIVVTNPERLVGSGQYSSFMA